MAKKKKNQDTSPLAMGRKQQGSAANKKAKKDSVKTGTSKVKDVASSAISRGSQSSASQSRINQKSYGTTRPNVTARTSGTSAERQKNTQYNNNLKQTQAQANRQRLEEDRIRREQESKARRSEAQYQKTNARPTAATAEQMRQQQEAARRQKMGLNSMATAEQSRAANRAVKNTPAVVKKAVQDTVGGHKKTIADVTDMTAERGTNAYAMKLGVDTKDTQAMSKVKANRAKTAEEARRIYEEENKKQRARQAEWDKRSAGANGLEKAYYGALESGTGMLTDFVLGMGTQAGALAAMGSRTYGQTRGQAEAEGATHKEDRLYSLMQAGKEVGTELMFPGAGLARRAYGKVGIPLAEVGANVLTKRLRGKAADIVGAGLRLAGGTGEEVIEEAAGWGLDPLIKEATYGKNVRERRKAELLQGLPQFENREEAESAAAYLSSGFIEDTKKALIEQGLSDKEASDYAEKLRDFYSAYYSGDEDTMDKIAGEMTGTGKKWDLSELRDTIASTALLTGVTGLPGAITTTARGAAIRDNLGDEGVRSLANFAVDFEDKNASIKGEVARDRLNEGKELTATQVYDLAVAQMKQDAADIERVKTAQSAAADRMESENLVEPYIVRQDGMPVMGEATRTAYSEAESDARKIFENKESITEEQIDDGARAVAGFQTGVFTVNDANALNYSNTAVREAFSEATGIDLDQYVVKGKGGIVDIPATNKATKDALFAMASDNLVRSAEAETANWMDNVKGEVVTQVTARMSGKGSLALQLALDDVDERNRSEYMMTANAADMMYQQGRNIGVAWDTISNEAKAMFPSISENKLRMMYEAGIADREIANNKAIGLQVKMGEKISAKGERTVPGGKVFVDTMELPKGTEIRLFSEIANQLGADIHLVDQIVDKNGNVVEMGNGSYDPNTNSFYINLTTGAEQNIVYIFMHECTHYLKVNAPEQYQELENLVRERWFSANPEQMQNAIARKIEAYKAVGQNLTEEQALEEIIADAAHEFINDPNFAQQVAEENPSVAKALLDSIRNALRMLRRILSSGSIEDETHMNSLFSELGILDEAERLWLNAYTQAVKNRADQAINDWQDAVYESNVRFSIPEYTQEEMDAHRQYLIESSAESYEDPYTNDLNESGFIFPDGSLPRMGEYGARADDHNLVIGAYDDIGYDTSQHPKADAMARFLNEGNIRYMPENGSIELGTEVEPTYEQYERIREMDYVNMIEFTAPDGSTVDYKEYDGDRSGVVNDIKRFYRDGEIGGSELAQFRYSISDAPSMKELDGSNSIVEDDNGNPIAQFSDDGAVRFSISVYDEQGRKIYTDYLNKMVKSGELSQEEADDMLHELETTYEICKRLADQTDADGNPIYAPYTAWSYADVVYDNKGKPVFSSIKKNSEYKMNIDFSTICKKRRTLDAVFKEMIDRGMFEKLDLNKDESAAMVVNINNLIRQHKFEAACALCFVEARRYRQQQTSKTFTDMWNGLVESMYKDKDKIAYFNFGEDSTVKDVSDGIHTMDDSELDFTQIKKIANAKKNGKPVQTAEAKAARLILNNPDQRKLMRVGDMMASTGFENMQVQNPELMKVYNSKKGTGGAKSSFGDVQYLNEIIRSSTFDRMKAYGVSGVRIQSFSDYVPRMVFDYVQVIADLAAKKLPAHAYTKEKLFVYQFGLTGAKINLSLVPDVVADGIAPGLDANGNYIWNEEGTFPYEEAMEIQQAEGYKENCGTIAVGISDKQIRKMLDDPTIQMVIPYHKSSLNPIVAAMTNVGRFTNYEDFQNTKDSNGKAVKKDFDWDKKLFRLTHNTKGELLPKEKWGNVQDLVKEYVEWCEKKNYTPKFSKFLYMEDGSINPGYYKLLEDFALLDNDGNFKPQGDVQMRFPTEESAFGSMEDLIKQGLSEDADLEAMRTSEISGIVDEIEAMFEQGTLTEQSETSEKLAQKFSISPEMDSDDNILSDGQMEFFKSSQARDEQGRLIPVYHATDMGGFTIFDPSFSDDKRSLFFSNRRDVAKSYAYNGGDVFDFTPKKINSWGDLIRYGRQLFSDADISWDNDTDEANLGFELFNKQTGEPADIDYDEWLGLVNSNDPHADDYRVKIILPYNDKDGETDSVTFEGNSVEELLSNVSNGNVPHGGHYQVYLNLENPLLIEGHGQPWTNIDGYNTREWAEYAADKGYDGVIFRDIIDVDNKTELFDDENKALSDIYIAFASSQIKDTRNLNPTENPDIRYSITPEDEAKSRIAYEDAMDNSYEALTYYEQLIGMVDPETYHMKAFNEEKASEFFAALRADETVPSNDPVLEEDRVRMAKSKADFYSSLNAKWQDRWTTEGEVLDIKSVKTDIRNLVIGVMNNSDTTAKYRNNIVKKTLMDVRTAFQLMKQDRPDIASYLLYHSAQRMIDDVEFYVDDTFSMYKDLRDYLRTTRITLSEEYWSDVDYDAFRKRNYGRLKLVKGGTNVDQVYQELQERYPEWFNEEEDMTPPDQLLQIEHVLDSIQPYKEAYSSEAAAELSFDIADELYEIMVGGREYKSLADRYKERYDAKTKAMKQRHAEAMLRMRKARDEGVQAERAKWRAREEGRKERTAHNSYFDRIKSTYDKLTDRLLSNTADKHIPEQYKKELAGLLAAFDFQTVRSKDIEAKRGYKAQKTIRLESMRSALERIQNKSQLFQINDSVTDIINDLLGLNEEGTQQSIEGKTLDELNSSELKKIDNLLRSLLHEFNNYEKVRVGTKKQQAADIGHAQNDISLEHANELGAGQDYQTPFLQSIDRLINLDMMTPAYMFRMIDPNNEGLGLMWKEIRRSFDKYVRNTNQLNDWIEEIVGKYHDKGILWNKYGSGELTNWRSTNYAKTFNLTNGSISLTPAQMMSVYCLAQRGQAYDHMVGAGVVAAPVSFQAKIMSDVKQKVNKALPLILTDADIKTIVSELTPEQIDVAQKLQQLMATKMADWGNEASMNVIGIRLFEDPDYFPIRSDRAGLTKDLDPNQFEQAIRNFGFTKAVQPGARNAIMIDDIFDVVTEHCNNMNLYNSYTEAMNDFMKVYNYREFREEGEYTVEQALRHAFSDKAPLFIMQFMRDLNGNVGGRASGIENLYNALLSNAKKSSVFANFRVAAQQPTAISRAFYVIDAKYMKGIEISKGAMTEMFEHCPIALWKSWGYYDINMGKSIEDVIMNNGRWLEDKATDLYGALDNVTWTAIWQMVKAEMKDTHPNVKVGTDEYWDLCNERMSEIVDLTQVVDSPMHRSHAMRDKGFFKKLTTSFMAEPTLTFNMLRDGLTQTREAVTKNNLRLASQILTKTIGVYLLQCTMVAGAQSIIDALRGKNPSGDDDDDDESLQHLFWVNFLENWKDEFNPAGKIYVIKDIKSMMDGWENRNLALQGVYYLSLGFRQLNGDPYARSSKSWYENMAYGLGYLTGIPIKTMMTGIANAMKIAGIESPALHSYGEFLDSLAKEKNDSETVDTTSTIGKLFTLIDGDTTLLKRSAGKTEEPEKASKEEGEKADETADAKAKAENDKETLKKLEEKAKKKAAGLSGDELDEALWDVLGDGYTKKLDEADMDYIEHLELIYMNNGGDIGKFEARIKDRIDTAYKKTLKDDMTTEDYDNQYTMRLYMQKYGYTDEEISDIVYHTYARSDLQAAMRMGNQKYIEEEASKLILAGLTEADFEKAYKNRNRGRKTYKGKYTDEKYKASTGTYIWPTQGPITSEFGYRDAPTAGASSNHPAIDIGAAEGSPVVAADGGTVISVGWNGGYGNQVAIQHDNGVVTYYSHLSGYNVNVGDQVSQGSQIAQVGSTGISTGPHLDFKVEINGEPVNPLDYLAS